MRRGERNNLEAGKQKDGGGGFSTSKKAESQASHKKSWGAAWFVLQKPWNGQEHTAQLLPTWKGDWKIFLSSLWPVQKKRLKDTDMRVLLQITYLYHFIDVGVKSKEE